MRVGAQAPVLVDPVVVELPPEGPVGGHPEEVERQDALLEPGLVVDPEGPAVGHPGDDGCEGAASSVHVLQEVVHLVGEQVGWLRLLLPRRTQQRGQRCTR